MKLKYMLRGLGIGVVITAAVMGAYSRNAVADARVAVLREYGFGDESRLVGETESSDEVLSEEISATEPVEPENMRDEEREAQISSAIDAAKESEQGAESGEQQSAEPSGGDAPAESFDDDIPQPSQDVVTPSGEGAAEAETVEIVIASGDDSGTVARKLYNAGLIENASEYDAFLMQHGYDKRLSTGTKTIAVTDSWQQIADKITR